MEGLEGLKEHLQELINRGEQVEILFVNDVDCSWESDGKYDTITKEGLIEKEYIVIYAPEIDIKKAFNKTVEEFANDTGGYEFTGEFLIRFVENLDNQCDEEY